MRNAFLYVKVYVVRCAIWYHLYHLKNVKITHGVLAEITVFFTVFIYLSLFMITLQKPPKT